MEPIHVLFLLIGKQDMVILKPMALIMANISTSVVKSASYVQPLGPVSGRKAVDEHLEAMGGTGCIQTLS